jgi:hypothetical protein
MLVSLLAVPLALALHNVKLGGPAHIEANEIAFVYSFWTRCNSSVT